MYGNQEWKIEIIWTKIEPNSKYKNQNDILNLFFI